MSDGEILETALWERVEAGDADAFGAIFDRHVERVHRHARRFAANVSDAEDITALVFFEAWRSRRRVRIVDGSVLAWLLVTATNVSRNTSRARMRYEQALGSLRVEHVQDHADAVLAGVERERMREPVRTAFAGLSRADQEILALCIIEELRPREVAVLMRVPSATVRTRLSRAKQRLRTAVDATHPGSLDAWMEA